MKRDKITTFSSAQAVTAQADSDNKFKMSGTPVARDLFTGNVLWIVTTVDVAFTDSGSDSTLSVELMSSADDSSYSLVQTMFIIPALAAVTTSQSTMYFAPIQPLATDTKYVKIRYTPNNGNLSTGTVSTFMTDTVQNWKGKPAGYTLTLPTSF